MIEVRCETVSDLLPMRGRGGMSTNMLAAVDRHLATCAECAAHATVVAMVQRAVQPVPAGLETRVVTAVRAGTPVGRLFRRPAQLATAATLAAALIGGAFYMQGSGGPGLRNASTLEPVSTLAGGGDVPGVRWAAEQDPLLHGGSPLQEMSVEELELILSELDR